MKKIFACIALLICTHRIVAQEEPGNYNMMMVRFKYVYNNSLSDSLYKLYAPEMKAAVNEEQNKGMITDLHDKFGELKTYSFIKMQGFGIYRMEFSKTITVMSFTLNNENKISGLYFRPYDPSQFLPDSTGSKSNFVCNARNGKLYGTISSPDDKKKVPIVIIIAGSGPTDRDGNNSMGIKTYSYKMLADSLLKYNIACLRYDKRGIGESASLSKPEDSLRFEDMANDAADIIAQVKKDSRFSDVYILGHSEGSLVGMLVAEKEKVAGYISLAGIGRPAATVIKEQIMTSGAKDQTAINSSLDSLQKGFEVHYIPQGSESLLRKSVQPYMISWFRYDPSVEIKKIKIPVLIIQGNTDIQVSIVDANKLHDAKKGSKLVIINGMNHVLKDAPLDKRKNILTYTDPVLPIKTELVSAIRNFVK